MRPRALADTARHRYAEGHLESVLDHCIGATDVRQAGGSGYRRLALLLSVLLLCATKTPAVAQTEAEGIRSVSVRVEGIDGALRDNVLAFLSIAELEERGIIARLRGRDSSAPRSPSTRFSAGTSPRRTRFVKR